MTTVRTPRPTLHGPVCTNFGRVYQFALLKLVHTFSFNYHRLTAMCTNCTSLVDYTFYKVFIFRKSSKTEYKFYISLEISTHSLKPLFYIVFVCTNSNIGIYLKLVHSYRPLFIWCSAG